MRLTKILVVISIMAAPHLAQSLEQKIPSSQQSQMNGIRFQEYGDFTKKWKFITVRYRKDTGEMRFTYANEKAQEAIEKNIRPFPDGSVFAKVGLITQLDPAFTSSVVPSGTRRFQYMVKDSKKYAETDGWGYALFQSNGDLFEGDMKVQTLACHACHKVVPDRDFVFSEKIELSPFVEHIQKSVESPSLEGRIQFEELNFKNAPRSLQALFKKMKIKKLFIVSGEMRTHFFGGTLDELTPLLIRKAKSLYKKAGSQEAAGFVSQNLDSYKILQARGSKSCPEGKLQIDTIERRVHPKLMESEYSECH